MLPGEPRHLLAGSGIPVVHDARGRVENVCTGSAMDITAGHYAAVAADRETFRSCGMANRKRPAETTGPLVRFGQVVTNEVYSAHLGGLQRTDTTPYS